MQRSLKKNHLNTTILFLLACGLLVRSVWFLTTHYILDDAFITFRYAAQIAAGNGFVHNTGERIYGTTTPLFALLLAGWRTITNSDIVTGAVILNLAASLGTLIFVWMALRKLGSTPAQQIYVIALLALSSRTVIAETKGMETAWMVLFMAASWWAVAAGHITIAGFFCGLLLWTRPDTLLWILALVLVEGRSSLRQAAQILLVGCLIYLPWAIFATCYFGSPIPHTITAKWVAYLKFNANPITGQIPVVLNYLSPISLSPDFLKINILAWLTILICTWQSLHARKNKWFNVLSIFAILEISRLIITKATFFIHYLYPALWTTMLIFGLGLGSLQNAISPKQRTYLILLGAATSFLLIMNTLILMDNIRINQQIQAVRNESALKGMGLWLNQNTPQNAEVLLEPLGYIGYYADRKIIDEVGLISPEVVEMKRNGIEDVYQYATAYHVNYIVAHCDEAISWLERSARGEITFAKDFFRAAKFNPLGFDPNINKPDNLLPRSACYEIWQRNHCP